MIDIDIRDIKNVAREAGREILKYYSKEYYISQKSDNTPVTEADLASDRIIRAGLNKYNIPILSEETEDSKSRLDSEYVWIIDPLDGTSDFIQGTDDFSVLIGLSKGGQPILGIVYTPVTDKIYFAEKGKGAFVKYKKNIKQIRVSNTDNFSEATIILSRNHLLDSEVEFFQKAEIKNKVKMGSAGLKICQIAEGRAEIYVSFSRKVSEWDTCAGKIILEEANGIITDMSGRDLTYNNPNPKHLDGLIASNGLLQEKIIKRI